MRARATTPEWMDDPSADPATLAACLRDLERVNRMSLGYRPTLGFLARIARAGAWPARGLSVLDAGSGHGDTLRRIAAWAAARRLPVRLTGVDLLPAATAAARAATGPNSPITFRTGDALAEAGPVDVILSALFAHHLDDATLPRFLAWMERTATLGWFVNDLHRHWLPREVVRHTSRALRMHAFVQHDGPVSISRGFTRADWAAHLATARIEAKVEWWMPFRLCVARLRG
jgi:SAM-dependent methyltransferase